VNFPADAAAGDYPFRLRAVAINDPDNDHAEGPATTAKLGAGGGVVKKSLLWLWILLGVLALIAVGVLLYFLLSSGKPHDTVTNTIVDATPANDCKPGYVWRAASPADHVCVTPDSYKRVQAENGLADYRRAPGGGAYGPNTCKMGYVWREAFSGDFVCVEGDIRSLVAKENAEAAQHRR